MKKTEAISILATSVRPMEAKDRARYDEAVRMEIEALKCSETPKSSEQNAETVQPDHNADVSKKVADEDCISRRAAIDIFDDYNVSVENGELEAYSRDRKRLCGLPPAQPELTDERSIAHLQSSGWMQRHDKEMYESGLKEQLADDSNSYDSLLPTVHPEVIRCGDCKFAHITNDGRYCKYCDMFTDDYGQLIEMYFESNFYCGYAERKINERTG